MEASKTKTQHIWLETMPNGEKMVCVTKPSHGKKIVIRRPLKELNEEAKRG